MAETIKGINVVIGAETTGLGSALVDIDKKSKALQAELRQVEKLLKLDPTNTDLVAQKQKLLGDAVANTTSRLDTLKSAQEQVNEQFARGEIKEEAYRNYQREVQATEQSLKRLETQLAETKKGFDFRAALDGASQSLKDVGKNLTDTGKDLSKNLTAPIVAAGAGLAAIATKTANAGDEIAKMSARTGLSTETLSEYRHAADLSGISMDAMETSVKKMQNTIYDASNGSTTAAEAISALGLSVQGLQGLSPELQFEKLAAAIAEVEDPTRRAAMAQDVFGKSGTDLLPMLSGGAEGLAAMRQEARDLGLVWTGESAAAAEKFNDDITRVKAAVAGAFQAVGQRLVPVLTEQLIPAIQEKVVPVLQAFAEKIGGLIQWFANLDPKWQMIILAALGFAAAVGPLLVLLGTMVTAIGSLLNPIGLAALAIAGVTAFGVALAANWDTLKTKAAEVWAGISATIKGAANSIIGFVNGIISATERMVNALAGALNKIPRFEIPAWVPGIGGKSFGLPKINEVSFPKIPLLAEGGIITRPTLAMLGEAGPEAVVPLGRMGPSAVNIYIEMDSRILAAQLGQPLVDEIRVRTGLRI